MSSRFTHALLRPPSRSLERCELLHLPRTAFDFAKAWAQHEGYGRALVAAGVAVTLLPEAPELPDAVFVEDTAVVLDECAILCRPGVESRRAEVELIRAALARHRPVVEIRDPGTLEGGDVLAIGRTLFVGRSTRTNAEGIAQLRGCIAPHGYTVREVTVHGSLHLKTAVTFPAEGMVVMNPAWIDAGVFAAFDVIPVPAEEPWGANTLAVNGRVIVAASAPLTAELLRRRGCNVHAVEISELQKAEAGVTCLSVLSR